MHELESGETLGQHLLPQIGGNLLNQLPQTCLKLCGYFLEPWLLTKLSTELHAIANRCEYLFNNLMLIHFILNFYTNRLAIAQRSDLLSVQAMKVIS